jgi:MFS family permease
MRFFRSAPFAGASAIAVLTFAGIGGFLFLNTLYLQNVRGLSPLHAGLYMLPMAAMIAVCAPISGRLVGRQGARAPMLVAAGAILAASLMLTGITPTTSVGFLFVAYVLFGIGNGLINPPITNAAVTGMPAAQAGVASAVASTSRQVGMTLGVAVIGALSGGSLEGHIGRGFASATHTGWWIIAALALLIAVIAAVTTGEWAKATAHTTAERLDDETPDDGGAYDARGPAVAAQRA